MTLTTSTHLSSVSCRKFLRVPFSVLLKALTNIPDGGLLTEGVDFHLFFKVLTHAGCSPAHPRAPGQCLHFECRGGPARVGCGDARGSPPLPSTLPHHLCVCVCVPWRNLLYLYLTSSDGVVSPELRICRASNKGAYTLAVVSHSGQRHNSLAQQRVR